MKTFKKLLSEVAEPQAGDEINFKKKHIIQRFYDPAGNDDAFTGNVSTEWDMVNGKRFYNHADYKDGEDEDVYESYGMLKQHHGAMAKQHNNSRINLPVGSKEREAHRKAALAHQKAFNAVGTKDETSLSSAADMATKMARRLSDIKESEQLDEVSDKKLRTYMKAASDIAAKSDDEKTVAKRTSGVLKASEKIKEAHSHPLYDMHGLEDEDINNDGVVDAKDAAMKRARELIQKKRYYLEDVADDTTHIKNHGTKKKYAKTNAVLAPTHKVKSIVEEEQLDELSKKTLGSYIRKAAHDAVEKSAKSDRLYNNAGDLGNSIERNNYLYKKSIEAGKKADNRLDGIKKASYKLAEDGAAYAIGMSKAKEIHNDEPPLRKKTIKTAHKIAKAIIGESDENCNCYHIAGSEDSHHIENLKSLAPNSKIADGIVKVSRADEEAIAYMDRHFPSLHEDVDQLDEISDEMKAKYLDKAVQQRYDFFTKGRNDPNPLKRRKPMSYYEKPEVKKALAKDARRGEIIDKTSKELTGRPHYGFQDGNAGEWWKGKKYSTESVELDEAMKLDSVNIVHHDEASADFAKKYVKAHKGDHREGGPTAADERAQDQFYTDHGYKHIRHGFGGSGETHYKDGKTGHIYSVKRVANGKGFHGTDHIVRKLNEDVDQLNAVKQLTKEDIDLSEALTGARLGAAIRNANKGQIRFHGPSGLHRIYDKNGKMIKTGEKHYTWGQAAKWIKDNLKEDIDQLDELSKDTLNGYKQSAINRNKSDAEDYKAEVKYTMNKYGHNHSVKANDLKNQMKKREKYISLASKKITEESLNEAFSAGSLKLSDGSSVTVSAQDAKLLNQMFNDLNPVNKKKMEKVLMTDKHGFQEILGFAREAL